MEPITLEDYLENNHTEGIIDHVLRAELNGEGKITFYIHPQGRDGETLDFEVTGNSLDLIKAERYEFK